MTTTTIPTSDLTGAALDWAVAKANGIDLDSSLGDYLPSTDWAQGGPIIEREGIETAPTYTDDGKTVTGWTALMFNDQRCEPDLIQASGPTLLIAAMRCYVHSKLGDTVDVPEELAT